MHSTKRSLPGCLALYVIIHLSPGCSHQRAYISVPVMVNLPRSLVGGGTRAGHAALHARRDTQHAFHRAALRRPCRPRASRLQVPTSLTRRVATARRDSVN